MSLSSSTGSAERSAPEAASMECVMRWTPSRSMSIRMRPDEPPSDEASAQRLRADPPTSAASARMRARRMTSELLRSAAAAIHGRGGALDDEGSDRHRRERAAPDDLDVVGHALASQSAPLRRQDVGGGVDVALAALGQDEPRVHERLGCPARARPADVVAEDRPGLEPRDQREMDLP